MEKVYRSVDRMIFETEKECLNHEKELYQNLPRILMGVKEHCDTFDDECPNCPFWNEEVDCCRFSEYNLNYPANWKNLD